MGLAGGAARGRGNVVPGGWALGDTTLGRVQHFETPWTVARQAPPSMGVSRQGYWSGLPFPPPRALPDPGIKSAAPALQVDSIPPWCAKSLVAQTVKKLPAMQKTHV